MRTYEKIVESFAVLFDPANPGREPAFDVHVVKMVDLEDGSTPFMDPRTPRKVLNVAEARRQGFDLPAIAAAMSSVAVVAMHTERARAEKSEVNASAAAEAAYVALSTKAAAEKALAEFTVLHDDTLRMRDQAEAEARREAEAEAAALRAATEALTEELAAIKATPAPAVVKPAVVETQSLLSKLTFGLLGS